MALSESYTDEIRELSNYDLNILIEDKDNQPKEKIIAALRELDKRGALHQEDKKLLAQLNSINFRSINTGNIKNPLPKGPFMDPNITDDPALPRLFSRYSIRFFAILFSTFFGGILLSVNMSRLKKNNQIFPVLLFSFLFAYLTVFVAGKYPERITLITLIMNILGSLFLEELFWNRQIGREFKFRRQNILPALFIGFLVSMMFLLAVSTGIA